MKEFNEQDRTKKWIVCFTNEVNSRYARSGLSLEAMAEKIVRLQVNLILICYKLTPLEKKAAELFVSQIKKKRKGLPACESFFCLDQKESDIQKLFRRIANYKIDYYQPLIMETFRW